MSSAKGAGSDIIKLMDSIPEIDAESTEGKTLNAEDVRGEITLQNIHFRYPTRLGVRVLRDLSLKVEPGTYIALVGASGSGKSTVIQLLERFYSPLAGDIYVRIILLSAMVIFFYLTDSSQLDGTSISEFSIQEYRKHIALVSQEPVCNYYWFHRLHTHRDYRHFIQGQFVSTSCLGPPNLTMR